MSDLAKYSITRSIV